MTLAELEDLIQLIPQLPVDTTILPIDLASLDLRKAPLRVVRNGKRRDFHFFRDYWKDIIDRTSKSLTDVKVVAYPFSQSDLASAHVLFPDAELYILIDEKPAISTEAFSAKETSEILRASKSTPLDYQLDDATSSKGLIGPPLLGIIRDFIPDSRILEATYFTATTDPESAIYWQEDPWNPRGQGSTFNQTPIHAAIRFDKGSGTKTQTVLFVNSKIGRDGKHCVPWTRDFFEVCDYQALLLKAMNIFPGRVDEIPTALHDLLRPVRTNSGVLITDTEFSSLHSKLSYGSSAREVPLEKKGYVFGYAKEHATVVKF